VSSRSACPARSSSTGFSLCGLSCGPAAAHRLKPVLLKTFIQYDAIRHSEFTSPNRFIAHL